LLEVLLILSVFEKTSAITLNRPAIPFGNRQIYFRGSFQSALSQFKKYHPSGNLKFNNLGIFQSSKLRILVEKKSFKFLLSLTSI